MSEITELLKGVDLAEYGEDYRAHTLELFRDYVSGAEAISTKRQTTNAFFLALNSAIIGFVGYVQTSTLVASDAVWFSLVSVAGAVLSYLWYRMVRSYRSINSAKFEIISEVEKNFPLRLYEAEWELVGRGRNPARHLPFTRVEIAVPWVFFALHGSVVLQLLGSGFIASLNCGASAA